MKRNLFGLSGTLLAALFLAGCAGDPTEDLRGSATDVATSLSFAEILVGDSANVQAQTRDAQGNALPILPEISSSNTAIATIGVDDVASGNPVPETVFVIRAVGFGATTVTARSGDLSETIDVQTFPASVDVTAPGIMSGDQVPSGTSFQATATALSTDGNPVTGPETLSFTFTSNDDAVLEVDENGNASTKAPGLGVVQVEGDGGATGQLSFEVVPAAFDGTTNPATAAFGDEITLNEGAVAWDANTQVIVGGLTGIRPTWRDESNAAAGVITFRIGDIATGATSVTILNVGPDDLAFETNIDVTSGWTPNALPETEDITAGPFPITRFISLSGSDPNHFLTFTPGADLDLSVTLSWQGRDDLGGGDGEADLDILWCDAGCANFVGNFDGATGSSINEMSSVTVPAGATWNLWFNAFAMHSEPPTVAMITITSP